MSKHTTALQDYLVFFGTWNVGTLPPPENLNDFLRKDRGAFDIYIVCFQEVIALKVKNVGKDSRTFQRWNAHILKALGSNYSIFLSRQLFGLGMTVFVTERSKQSISHVQTGEVSCGIFKPIPNKGAIILSFFLNSRPIAVVGSHLTSGREKNNRRHEDYLTIVNACSINVGSPTTIFHNPQISLFDHDYVFWLGDLNYRMDTRLSREIIEDLFLQEQKEQSKKRMARRQQKRTETALRTHATPNQPKNDLRNNPFEKQNDSSAIENQISPISKLLCYDQLLLHRLMNSAFSSFNEMRITFPPTYRYNSGTYVFDTSHKLQFPAWCDRILFHTSDPRVFSRRLHDSIRGRTQTIVKTTANQTSFVTSDIVQSSSSLIDDTHLFHLSPLLYDSVPFYTSSDHRPVIALFKLSLFDTSCFQFGSPFPIPAEPTDQPSPSVFPFPTPFKFQYKGRLERKEEDGTTQHQELLEAADDLAYFQFEKDDSKNLMEQLNSRIEALKEAERQKEEERQRTLEENERTLMKLEDNLALSIRLQELHRLKENEDFVSMEIQRLMAEKQTLQQTLNDTTAVLQKTLLWMDQLHQQVTQLENNSINVKVTASEFETLRKKQDEKIELIEAVTLKITVLEAKIKEQEETLAHLRPDLANQQRRFDALTADIEHLSTRTLTRTNSRSNFPRLTRQNSHLTTHFSLLQKEEQLTAAIQNQKEKPSSPSLKPTADPPPGGSKIKDLINRYNAGAAPNPPSLPLPRPTFQHANISSRSTPQSSPVSSPHSTSPSSTPMRVSHSRQPDVEIARLESELKLVRKEQENNNILIEQDRNKLIADREEVLVTLRSLQHKVSTLDTELHLSQDELAKLYEKLQTRNDELLQITRAIELLEFQMHSQQAIAEQLVCQSDDDPVFDMDFELISMIKQEEDTLQEEDSSSVDSDEEFVCVDYDPETMMPAPSAPIPPDIQTNPLVLSHQPNTTLPSIPFKRPVHQHVNIPVPPPSSQLELPTRNVRSGLVLQPPSDPFRYVTHPSIFSDQDHSLSNNGVLVHQSSPAKPNQPTPFSALELTQRAALLFCSPIPQWGVNRGTSKSSLDIVCRGILERRKIMEERALIPSPHGKR
ncbi:putative Inositol polyphosphate 5-phosphatase OCRL [Blattamonas nauphoetae]|uniref:Inositol polyphosphate 5-phosphatase OCRL n=1 Tax=Blattamonas nauphoetae TaxID=2049346 RepID=A0ABQ9YFG2_9EUKA|nr:putative Inositol polyphosphate 5-phosphatase OCRL [Blattamonas nauphoetae]